MIEVKRTGIILFVILATMCRVQATEIQESETYTLPDVVVTPSRSANDPNDVPADIAVLPEAQIQIPEYKNVLDALRPIPGIKINDRQNNGVFGLDVDIHGLQSNATSGGNLLFILDGVPQRRLSFGGPYYGALPHAAVNRMELVEGALTTQYGRGAMLGTLQMFTDPVIQDQPYSEFSTNYESETDYMQQIFKGVLPFPNDRGYFSATGSYDNANGWQDDTGSHHRDIYINTRIHLTESDTLDLFGGSYSGRDNVATPLFINTSGDPEPFMDWEDNLSTGHNYLDLDEHRAGGSWTHDWTDSLKSKVTVAYWRGDTEWGVNRPWSKPATYSASNPLIDTIRYMTLYWEEDSYFTEASLTYSYDVSDSIEGMLTGGVNYEVFNWDNTTYNFGNVSLNAQTGATDLSGLNMAASPTVTETEAVFWGPFVVNTLNFGEDFILQAGLRYDDYENDQKDITNSQSFSGSQDFFSPSAGATYHWYRGDSVQSSVYANWGRNYNPVTRTGVSAGILDADPERSQTTEAGLRTSFWDKRAQTQVSIYHIDREDVPQRDPGGSYTYSADWQIQGVEVLGQLAATDQWMVFAGIDLPNPIIDKDQTNPTFEGNQIMFASEQQIKFGARYRPVEYLWAGFQTTYIGETFADSANTVDIPDYWLTDLHIGYTWKTTEIAFFMKNVFDEKYFSGAFDSSDGLAFAGTPRTIGIGAKIYTN